MPDTKPAEVLIVCPDCDGQGEIVTRHPNHGARWCPEPTTSTVCHSCGGQGAVTIPKAA